MCGILGLFQLQKALDRRTIGNYAKILSDIITHRGPDDQGVWVEENARVALAHNRLSIIDLSDNAHQPMVADNGLVIVFNGEIYNYIELRDSLKSHWNFRSKSDTEVILALYSKYGNDCLQYLRGMFAFAIWDPKKNKLFCARDRFGIKPFYFYQNKEVFAFASEAKALLPLVDKIETNKEAFSEYLVFQYTLGNQTLFEGIKQLLPGECLSLEENTLAIKKYWNLEYHPDPYHTEKYFCEQFEALAEESMSLHLRSDVPVASYLSGGVDSSIVASLAHEQGGLKAGLFHGRFNITGYDESNYAQMVADKLKAQINILDIGSKDFVDNISNVIYHLDFPIAGPGSFPQFMVSKYAAQSAKVILGGQGGDELFGGYARYLIAYFEQAISAAIDDTHHNGNFVVTPESIIPNLKTLREYKPLIKQFWKDGLFESLDKRYLRLINRMVDFNGEVDLSVLNLDGVNERFYSIFNAPNVAKASYFDKMTHFDLACLLPALLQVEDRVSMAFGLESRVPFLDHKLAEFVANIPADIKFRNGAMKHMLKKVFGSLLPQELINRRDKMGFPVPLKEWFTGELKDFVGDTFNKTNNNRPFLNKENIMKNFSSMDSAFSRKAWGLLSMELWYQNFHDRELHFKSFLKEHNVLKVGNY
ncbi:MAG: Asparagine synthetase [Candidatus Midichloriaceae bacterium]|jgi:asparagine synthase (glutamine-hydrolysing)|nr:Asparagine synthetase [Candidatus Midichloriaceae bacterium]